MGFILRLIVDEAQQRRGYGRAPLQELVRRLRLVPEVEAVATSHGRENDAMAALCASLGFEPWEPPWPSEDQDEVFLTLPTARSSAAGERARLARCRRQIELMNAWP